MDSSTCLVYSTSIKEALDVVNYAGKLLRVSTGFDLPITNQTTSTKSIRFVRSEEQLAKEAYVLEVKANEVLIYASSRNGLFYGFQTFLQLLPVEIYSSHTVLDVVWTAPLSIINDSPRFEWRGFMLDVSRHFFGVESVKKALDVMALHKLNRFHWHLTDDNGWRLEIKRYPNFTKYGSTSRARPLPWSSGKSDNVRYGPFFYTQEQVKDVVEYARARNIVIVPEIEMPGHALAGIAGYPEISCTGGPFEPLPDFSSPDDVYCPGNDRTIEILQGVLDEVMELFDSEFIHVGGDECKKTRWKSCAKCQKRMKDEGISSYENLQLWFTNTMADYIESKGRHLIGWDEILDSGLQTNAAIMSWRGTSGGATAASLGHKVVMSPNSYLYIDMHQFAGNDVYQYIKGMKPLYSAYRFDPLSGIHEDYHKYIIGVQGNLWTEYVWGGDYDMHYKAFPRETAVAEVGWTSKENRNWPRFVTGLVRSHLDRLQAFGVHHAPISLATRAFWTPEDMKANEWVTKEWVINGGVSDLGWYGISFVWKGGKNALKMKNVRIMYGWFPAAEDSHEGIASWEETGTNEYDMLLVWLYAGETLYVKADVQGVNGNDSYGEIVVFYETSY